METLRTNALTLPKNLTKRHNLKVAMMFLAALLVLPLPSLATPPQNGPGGTLSQNLQNLPTLTVLPDLASYAYIITTPQLFGDKDTTSQFAVNRGQDHEYSFNLPGVDRNKAAILMLRTALVSHKLNSFTINGHPLKIFHGRGHEDSEFSTDHVEVPGWMLKETGNELKISARNSSGGLGGDLDDFLVDDVVLIYKT
jgi:hypothetical protein